MTEVLAQLGEHRSAAWEAVAGERRKPVYRLAKRAFDLVVALLLLLVLSPLLLAIALAIVVDSGRPVLFRQARLGAVRRPDGTWQPTPFTILKFRSMAVNADESVHAAHIRAFVDGQLTKSGVGFKLEQDPRLTRIGRFLRRTSADELPQLLNVVRGQMSLVGPRPVPLYEATLYKARYARRFAALPGITGLWQVRGRASLTVDEMMELDLDYVDRASLALDLRILAATVPAVLRGEGVA